jgi:MFS family permease
VSPPPADQAEPAEPSGRRPSWRWAVLAGLAGAAASTLATALAAAVAGRHSDVALRPVELALRVGLLLGAPCVGAVLAALVVPVPPGRPKAPPRTPPNHAVTPGGGRLAVVAVGLGVPVGPLLVLRLERVREFGLTSALLTLGVMVAWGVVGAALAAGWWARPDRQVQRTELPLPLPPAPVAEATDTLEASGETGPRGPAA